MNPNFRDQKRQARRVIHDTLSQSALYLATLGSTPVPVTIRLHTSNQALGVLARGEGYAEVDVFIPRMVFMNSQLVPAMNSFVITEDLGAFKIGNVLPAHDITTTAQVAPVPNDQAVRQGWDRSLPYMGLPSPSIV